MKNICLFLINNPMIALARVLMGASVAEVSISVLNLCSLFHAIMAGLAIAGNFAAVTFKIKLPKFTHELTVVLAVLSNTFHYIPQDYRIVSGIDIPAMIVTALTTYIVEKVITASHKPDLPVSQ